MALLFKIIFPGFILMIPGRNEFVINQVGNRGLVKDSLVYDTLVFPNPDKKYTANLLTAGVFHHDEVWPGAEKEKWFGLWQDSAGYYIAETKIKIAPAHDPILDGEDENVKTGWEVSTPNPDYPVILFSGIEGMKNRRVLKIRFEPGAMQPGEKSEIFYFGQDFELVAEGRELSEITDSEWRDVVNYKLFFSGRKNGKKVKQLLAAQPNFSGSSIGIAFIGDLDGDKIPDFIIDNSRHYNVSNPTLYLSGAAGPGELVVPVAAHRSVGC